MFEFNHTSRRSSGTSQAPPRVLCRIWDKKALGLLLLPSLGAWGQGLAGDREHFSSAKANINWWFSGLQSWAFQKPTAEHCPPSPQARTESLSQPLDYTWKPTATGQLLWPNLLLLKKPPLKPEGL